MLCSEVGATLNRKGRMKSDESEGCLLCSSSSSASIPSLPIGHRLEGYGRAEVEAARDGL